MIFFYYNDFFDDLEVKWVNDKLNISWGCTYHSSYWRLSSGTLYLFGLVPEQTFNRRKFEASSLIIHVIRDLRHLHFHGSSSRDWRQVYANGVVMTIFLGKPVCHGAISFVQFVTTNWKKEEIFYKLIKRQSCHHIETIQLICSANQLSGFYIGTLVFNELINKSINPSLFMQQLVSIGKYETSQWGLECFHLNFHHFVIKQKY